MKNIKLSIITLISLGFFGYGGGDIATVTPYESDDVNMAIEEAVPYITPTPTPSPTIIKKEPPKVVKPQQEIYSNGFYAGLGITGNRYSNSCKCTTSINSMPIKKKNKERNLAFLARVGYDFNPYIGIETRGVRSIAEDKDFKLSHIGLFLKPMIPIGDITNLYTILGFAKTKVTGEVPKVDAESFAFGGGLEFDLSKDVPKKGRYSRKFDGKGDQEQGVGVFLDYERLVVKKNTPNLDTITVGISYDF
jgi:opacity protein-like surface antigen